MNNFPLASVIIPSFNNENHINATLNSILEQDYENLEIIFVNDASTDNTLNIAEKILRNSKRNFKIINHEKNSGVSTARNTGIKKSSGEYICFCDGDDLLKGNYISSLMKKILEDDCDISFCGMIDKFEDGKPDKLWPIEIKNSKILNGDEALKLSLKKYPVAPSVCCMMFKKSFLIENELNFYDGCSAFEDIEFQLKAFCRAKKISFISEYLYVYVHSSEMGSVKNSDTKEKKLKRYIDSTGAHYRAAEYIEKFSASKEIKSVVANILMPEAAIRKFTILARMNDKDAYKSLHKDKEIRKILLRGLKNFFKKPEIFLKAFIILFIPDLYFMLRK